MERTQIEEAAVAIELALHLLERGERDRACAVLRVASDNLSGMLRRDYVQTPLPTDEP